jgi:competence protein ComEC
MLPFAAVQTHWFEPLWALPFVGILGMVHSARDRSLFRSWCLCVLAGANVPLYIAGRSSGEPGVLTVTVVDVGQGDAILIEHPDGGAVLIDTGPVPFDARSGLVPFLLRWGIEELDVVIITHPHDDHAGGLPTLRAAMPVRRLITHATADPGSIVPWKEDCRLQILNAVAVGMGTGAPEEEPNRLSVVMRLVYGNTAFLFAADAEQIEEDRMIAAYGDGLASAVLKVGHHGSRLGTTAAWLDAVRPTHAVISVGSKNRFGHPSDAVLRRLRCRNISLARTDEDGAIMMISDGQTVRRFLWR